MTGDDAQLQRLRFLARVVQRERKHLLTTDRRVFVKPFTQDRAQALADDVELAERVEVFAARFGRLQDTLGDKLIPALLRALGEPVGAAIAAAIIFLIGLISEQITNLTYRRDA
ncbi:hypothetical protein OS176_02050 [Xanthomonadaceae bacterium XH05]|nr:hypothetical protein [Xanthomonadaceae bacterium XH05]